MDFTGSQGILLAIIAASVVVTAMVLLYRYLKKAPTPPVGRTRFGFFIEHDYDHHKPPDEQITKEWPRT